eukprot:Sdes_comp23295_c0_seq1m21577
MKTQLILFTTLAALLLFDLSVLVASPTENLHTRKISRNAEQWIADFGETEDELSWFSEPCPDYENSGMFENFQDYIFVGHLHVDTDSVVASIAAAYFYKGTAALASALNAESSLVLDTFGFVSPPPYKNERNRSVCLIDHNQKSQIPPGLDLNLVSCLIDHHALQSDMIVVPQPIHIEVKPWGSCSTIIAWKYFDSKRFLPKGIAGLLLSGILSDSLALRSSVTTEADIKAVLKLSHIAGIKNYSHWAKEMFAVKANISRIGLLGALEEDFKVFTIRHYKVGFSNIETVHSHSVLNSIRKSEFQRVAQTMRTKEHLDFFFV